MSASHPDSQPVSGQMMSASHPDSRPGSGLPDLVLQVNLLGLESSRSAAVLDHIVWSSLSSLLREDSDLMFNIISDKIAVEITTVFSQVISVFTPNLQSNNNVVLESAS